jgi:hypothetical protein
MNFLIIYIPLLLNITSAGGRHYFELLKRFFNLGYKIHYNYKNALEIDRGTFIAQKY